jgi:hypothetical protein
MASHIAASSAATMRGSSHEKAVLGLGARDMRSLSAI